jgi:hypothetical protein
VVDIKRIMIERHTTYVTVTLLLQNNEREIYVSPSFPNDKIAIKAAQELSEEFHKAGPGTSQTCIGFDNEHSNLRQCQAVGLS